MQQTFSDKSESEASKQIPPYQLITTSLHFATSPSWRGKWN